MPSAFRDHVEAGLLIVLVLVLSSVVGMVFHEIGHVLHTWASGGRVVGVDLLPWHVSSTAVLPNPHPLVVVWGGPIWGCLIPLGAWLAVRAFAKAREHVARGVAGACLVGNGAYIGAGWPQRIGDAGDMVRLGCPVWTMIAFGMVAGISGIILWNRLAARFVVGAGRRSEIVAVAGILIGVTWIELALRAWLWPAG